MARATFLHVRSELEELLASEQKRIHRRVLIALLVAVLAHLFFGYFISPRIFFDSSVPKRTEVVQITADELARIKERIKSAPLALQENEIRPEHKTNEAPENAQFMGPHNQRVPKEQRARATDDVPLQGGGAAGRAAQQTAKAAPNRVKLSNLGLGMKIPKPLTLSPAEQGAMAGPPGPQAPYRQRGLEKDGGDVNMLNAVESKFYSFFARLEEPIIRNWIFLMKSHEYQIRSEVAAKGMKPPVELPVTIEFTIDRQGAFRRIEIVSTSGIRILDEATKQAIQKLGSIPNPPPALFEGGDTYTRPLRFMVYITGDPMGSSRPDMYW